MKSLEKKCERFSAGSVFSVNIKFITKGKFSSWNYFVRFTWVN